MTAAGGGLVRFSHLSLGYDGTAALADVTGEIAPGALLALIGPNGAGKSTLFKGIMGELVPLAGTLSLSGLKRTDIAYLPQRNDIDPSFPISVFDCVAMGLWRKIGAFGGIGRADRARVTDALDRVGLAPFAGHLVGSLSGGQLQRALFARLLLQDAPLILLDEPFRAIDAETVESLMRLVVQWHDEGRTVVAALHDTARVRAYFPETMILSREVVAWGPTAKVLTPSNLAKSGQAEDGAATAHKRAASPAALGLSA
ncbi:MAG: metal ABC transporter ATP-binding protein [Methyloligella sp. ZOD6]